MRRRVLAVLSIAPILVLSACGGGSEGSDVEISPITSAETPSPSASPSEAPLPTTTPGLPFDAAAIKEIVEDEESGVELTWYGREVREDATDAQIEAAGCDDFSGPYQGLLIGSIIRPFEPGNPPSRCQIPRRWLTSRSRASTWLSPS